MADIRSRFVMAGNVRTHYVEAGGDAPVLVALHGGGPGSSGEAGFGRMMTLVGEQARIIALDSPGGFGLTDPNAPVYYGMQSRVDHLEDFVEALCLEKFSIMGNSQGAWAAARYASLHPDRIEKIVLVASSNIARAMGLSIAPSEGMRVFQAYDGSREAMRRVLEVLIEDHSKITDELIDRRQTAVHRSGAMEAREKFRQGVERFTKDPLFSTHYDLRASLPRLVDIAPTIFIWGKSDRFAPPELGEQLEILLPQVRFHWIPEAGHQVQNDQPEMVSDIVVRFVLEPR